MYATIVIDDEDLIRSMIADFIEQEIEDFTVVARFSNGREALEYIRMHRVDAIISDIRMPQLSGLELAKIIHDAYRDIPIVIISGYSDFDYARQAIQYGVFNYLLKPIDFAELQETFPRLRARLKARAPVSHGNSQVTLFLTYVLAGLFSTPKELARVVSCTTPPFSVEDAPCCVLDIAVIMLPETNDKERENIAARIEGALRALLGAVHIYLLRTEGWHFYFAVVGAPSLPSADAFDQVTAWLLEHCAIVLSMACIAHAPNLPALAQRIATTSFGTLLRQSISDDEIDDNALLTTDKQQGKSGSKQQVFEQAAAFIRKNASQDLSREDVANAVFVSQSYLSHVFHEIADMSFNEYVNRQRMEKAVALLAHNIRIIDVMEQTGYRNKKTFLMNFRAYTGMTPSEYRQKMFSTKDYSDE